MVAMLIETSSTRLNDISDTTIIVLFDYIKLVPEMYMQETILIAINIIEAYRPTSKRYQIQNSM